MGGHFLPFGSDSLMIDDHDIIKGCASELWMQLEQNIAKQECFEYAFKNDQVENLWKAMFENV